MSHNKSVLERAARLVTLAIRLNKQYYNAYSVTSRLAEQVSKVDQKKTAADVPVYRERRQNAIARAPKLNRAIEVGSGTGSADPPPDLSMLRRYCRSALLKLPSPLISPIRLTCAVEIFPCDD
jgi:hypothetical protein